MSDCGVCIGGGFGYEIDDFASKIERSTEDLQCCECDRPIIAGTEHEQASGQNVEDGSDVCFVTCMDCKHIADALMCGERCYSVLWDRLEGEDLFAEITSGCVFKVKTASAKEYLLDRWRKWKGLNA